VGEVTAHTGTALACLKEVLADGYFAGVVDEWARWALVACT
jgi:hypothetical protein